MTELDLYKYITENTIEWHRQDNEGTPDIIIFPYVFQIEGFSSLVKSYVADEGLEVRLRDGYIAIWMKDLCDSYDIDMDKVFIGEEQ